MSIREGVRNEEMESELEAEFLVTVAGPSQIYTITRSS